MTSLITRKGREEYRSQLPFCQWALLFPAVGLSREVSGYMDGINWESLLGVSFRTVTQILCTSISYKVLPDSSAGKESSWNAGDPGSIPGLGRSPGKGKGYLRQYSSLKNSMDCIVHGIAKSLTWLSDFYFHFPTVKTGFSCHHLFCH